MTTQALVRPGDPRATTVRVRRGPAVLADVDAAPGLADHRARHGPLPPLDLEDLLSRTRVADLRGRGGAGFPFATKLHAAAGARGRPVVVVNLAEGEPASWKDTAVALVAPHLVLDGAVVAARALGARTVHVVLPADRPAVRLRMSEAVRERRAEAPGVRIQLVTADLAFVAGQASAVLELLAGRDNRPVTTWQPAAVRGLGGRPTLLSNAETFAHVGLLALSRVPCAGRTTLLTVDGDSGRPVVQEVEEGAPWEEVLDPEQLAGPVLLGGYHGTWAAPGALGGAQVSREALRAAGLALGAGIVLTGPHCPLHRAAAIATYLAGESAGRCGPCVNGLPRLASLLRDAAHGIDTRAEVARICGLVERRGACAHPDGTARMARTLVEQYGDEIGRHARGRCAFGQEERRRAG